METPSLSSNDSTSQYATKFFYFGNEYPTDNVTDLFRSLRRSSKSKNHRYLATFLEEATAAIQEEVAKLPRVLKECLLPFKTVLSLVDDPSLHRGPVSGALESTVLCISELATFIGHFEKENLAFDLTRTNTTLCGLSIGLLAAAAVSASSSLAELALIGAEAVRLSFRLGIHVSNVSHSIEPQNTEGDLNPWAYVVTGIAVETVQTEIDRYNREAANSKLTRISISAADKTSVSVTGPPSRLKDAFRFSQTLRYSRHLPLPVYSGICHAPHLYDGSDVETIVACNSYQARIRHARARFPLLSTQTGQRFQASTVDQLFRLICAEILTGTIHLDEVTNGILENISVFGKAECQFSVFSQSLIVRNFREAVERELPEVALEQVNMSSWLSKDEDDPLPRSPRESKLAIVGMSCRLPGGANDLELFWKIMEEGRDVHTTVPSDRFDLGTHYDPTGNTPNATETQYGNFIDNPGFFDAGFFNMSPKEAEQTDPMHRLALVTAYEALEMAGYAPNRTPSTMLGRVGTFYGQASDDWRELNAGQNIGTYAVPGGERAFANGRINYFFKFGGPSFNIDTACSSGLAAVNAACSALWSGEADMVIAGGLSVITNPDNFAMLCKGHFLSKTGQCKVWDTGADGYCRSDGIGSVVIKRLEDAQADRDNIIATICAAATNHSANAASITQPHVGAQKDNYRQVLLDAGVDPLEVSYIELHGTGTQVGDAVESESVAEVFAPRATRRHPDQRLHLGAVKSNIGHGEAAAGIASLLKALLVYQKNLIPRHVGIINEMNPVVARTLEKRNMGLAMENTLWPQRDGKPRYAIVNSFGAHGGNTTLLLADSPSTRTSDQNARSAYPITISAKSKVSLKGNVTALLQHLISHPDINLGDLAYTLCARRIHHNMRIATSVTNISQLKSFLETKLGDTTSISAVPINPSSLVFVFTGQGVFYKGISATLFKEFPFYRSRVIELDRRVQQLGHPTVIPVVDGSSGDNVSPVVSQLAIVVVEIALVALWEHLGVKPSAVIGHSLGEYAAMVAAGVLSAADAIYLAGGRAQLLLSSCEPGACTMLSVRASSKTIEEICGTETNKFELSCINGPEDTVISGDKDDMAHVQSDLESQGYKCQVLPLPYAFHTKQMGSILEPFEQMARHVSFKEPSIPFISPLLNNCVFDGKTLNAKYLSDATRRPVDFLGALEAARETGIIDDKSVWIEVGPHPICSSFIRNTIPGARLAASLRRGYDDFSVLSASLATLHCEGVNICWNEYFRPIEQALRLLDLPRYVWNEKNYWIPYEGTWTLDKAYPKKAREQNESVTMAGSALRTSSIHQIVSQEVTETTAELTALADIMHPDLLGSVKGHTMNGHGVATSSIWADMALTVSSYLHKLILPKENEPPMNITNLEVLHAQVANSDTSSSQLLQIQGQLDLATSSVKIAWFDESGIPTGEHYASATVRFENVQTWSAEWTRVNHLVNSRIEALQQMTATGKASSLSSSMAYTLFKNVVDYADKYRGMRSVVIKDHEAFADVTLVPEQHGTWHTPPHWIDSIFHLGGFVLNGSDASNTTDYFYVTPGWGSYRLLRPLEAGASYRSYVRMFPMEEANMYSGDVYVLQDDVIVGMMGQMKFRKTPRVLMNRFFSPKDVSSPAVSSGTRREVSLGSSKAIGSTTAWKPFAGTAKPSPALVSLHNTTTRLQTPPTVSSAPVQRIETVALSAKVSADRAVAAGTVEVAMLTVPAATTDHDQNDNPVIRNCMSVIARETGLDPSELHDAASFIELGVDSLMSLVLSEKFKTELQLDVKSSLFVECSNIRELKTWLEDYC